MTVKKLRQKIDRLDRKTTSLLNERARVSIQIGKLKRKKGGAMFDPPREREVYEKVGRFNRGPLSKATVQAIYREVISGARALEKALTVAYQGPPLTYAHLAAQKVFGSQITYRDVMTIGDVFTEIERDRADYGIVPIENSISPKLCFCCTTISLIRISSRIAKNVTIISKRFFEFSNNDEN